jgi:hypothetical protein
MFAGEGARSHQPNSRDRKGTSVKNRLVKRSNQDRCIIYSFYCTKSITKPILGAVIEVRVLKQTSAKLKRQNLI